MRPLFVTNSVITVEGNHLVITFENENKATAVRMSMGRAASLIHEISERIEIPGYIQDVRQD